MRGRRRSSRTIAVVAALAAAVAVACTAWDDVPLPADPAALEGGAPDGATRDGALDAAEGGALPAAGFLTRSEAVAACTVIAACPYLPFSIVLSLRVPVAETVTPTTADEQGLSATNFSFCVDQLSTTFEPNRPGRDLVAAALRKIAAASSCQEAAKSVRYDFQRHPGCSPGPDAGPPADQTCLDDATLLECDGPLGRLTHCSAAGGVPSDKCVTLDAGGTPLTGCLVPDGVCPVCEGSVATLCINPDPEQREAFRLPARYHTDCKALGLECAMTPGGLQLGCATSDHVVRGDGYRYPGAYCVNTGLYVSDSTFTGIFDCAKVGAVCAESSGAAVCAMKGAECTPFSEGANACLGSKIHLCVGGRWADVDCPLGCDAPDGSPQRGICRSAVADGG